MNMRLGHGACVAESMKHAREWFIPRRHLSIQERKQHQAGVYIRLTRGPRYAWPMAAFHDQGRSFCTNDILGMHLGCVMTRFKTKSSSPTIKDLA